MAIGWIDDVMLYRPCKVALCLSEADWLREMRRLNIGAYTAFLMPGRRATVHFFDNAGDWHDLAVVCIDGEWARGDDQIVVAALIVHESVHVFQYICEHWGEEAPGKEIEAYSIQRISQQLMRAYAEALIRSQKAWASE